MYTARDNRCSAGAVETGELYRLVDKQMGGEIMCSRCACGARESHNVVVPPQQTSGLQMCCFCMPQVTGQRIDEGLAAREGWWERGMLMGGAYKERDEWGMLVASERRGEERRARGRMDLGREGKV